MPIELEEGQATAPPATGVLAGAARVLVDRRAIVLLLAAVAVAGAVLAGLNVDKHLSGGGSTPASAESARADQILTRQFGAGAPNVVLVARAARTTTGGPAARAGQALTRLTAAMPGVVYAESYWTTGDRTLESRDGRTALILVKIGGDDDAARASWERLMPAVTGRHGPLTVQATGRSRSTWRSTRRARRTCRARRWWPPR